MERGNKRMILILIIVYVFFIVMVFAILHAGAEDDVQIEKTYITNSVLKEEQNKGMNNVI